MSFKPDWKDAPDWAKFVAMEPNGDWFWYSEKPEQMDYPVGWGIGDMDRMPMYAGTTELDWAGSLRERLPDSQ